MAKYKPGDLVGCYITNTKVTNELLEWGMILEVSDTLKDILVLDSRGHSNWWPSRRWTMLRSKNLKDISIFGTLA